MPANPIITVFGATGHTGCFVVAELLARGLTPVLSGRDGARLDAQRNAHPGLQIRQASIDDPASLDRALAGASAVINCAGPFTKAGDGLVRAAVATGTHYVDSTGEQPFIRAIFESLAGANVLTVGESEGFAKQGGVIGFVMEKDQVRFEINTGAARQAGLKIDLRLLKLAKRVFNS